MISHKFNFDLSTTGIFITYDNIKKSGIDIIDLTESNPTVCNLNYKELEIDYLLCKSDLLKYSPDPKGCSNVRNNISQYYSNRVIINKENIFLTSGTSEAYSYLFKLLTNPGDNIIIPAPSYPLLEHISLLENIDLKYYNLDYYKNNWCVNFDTLKNSINEKTKAILVINPNNPSGNYLSLNEFSILNKVCDNFGIPLIIDEVFWEYEVKGFAKPQYDYNTEILKEHSIFILNGFSKMLGLPQLKLGWICHISPEIYNKRISDSLEVIADSYLSVNTPVQLLATDLLAKRNLMISQIKERTNNNIEFIKTCCDSSMISEIQGGWNIVIKTLQTTNDKFVEKCLIEENIFFHPGYYYNFKTDDYIVISLLVESNKFRKGFLKLLKCIK